MYRQGTKHSRVSLLPHLVFGSCPDGKHKKSAVDWELFETFGLNITAKMNWKQAGKDKAESILTSIPKEWQILDIPSVEKQKDITGEYLHQYLSSKEVEITESDAVDIVKNTSTGVWSAVDVAKAFCHRAAIVHQHVACLHETFFDAAIADAEALDKYYAEHKKPIGTLHGLPVSLKDQFHVRNVETSMVSIPSSAIL